MRIAPAILVAIFAGSSSALAAPACPAPRSMHFQVERVFHRDVPGFTEGLEVHGHALYESTGAPGGGSRLLRMTPDGHASVLHVQVLEDSGDKFFGEGLTFLDGRIYRLTWRDHKVFVYDLKAHLLKTMDNPREGWGLTNDGHHLIFSDGGDRLYFANPQDFAIQASIEIRRGDRPVENINELEYVDGKIYANIWQTREIIRLDASTGCVEAEARMDTLWDHMTQAERNYTTADADFVLNGIAWDPGLKLFYLTGKEWPMVFVGRFVGD
jgi:glutamine cyclotransferase